MVYIEQFNLSNFNIHFHPGFYNRSNAELSRQPISILV